MRNSPAGRAHGFILYIMSRYYPEGLTGLAEAVHFSVASGVVELWWHPLHCFFLSSIFCGLILMALTINILSVDDGVWYDQPPQKPFFALIRLSLMSMPTGCTFLK